MQTDTLSTRQARFVQEYLIDGCGARAAIRSGVARSGAHVWASRALRKATVSAALATRQARDATRLSLRREDVLTGLLEAVTQAREQRNPAAMIAGWREVAKLLGFYKPEAVQNTSLTPAQAAIRSKYSEMPDSELLALLAGQGTPAPH